MSTAERTVASHQVAADRIIGDAEFADLYMRYRDPVFRYMRRMSASEDEAGDLTALAFERALARISSFRSDGAGFAPWLFRIARNLALDARRRRRPWIPLQLLPLQRHPRESTTPESEALRRAESSELLRQLDALPSLDRECLSLRYGAGLTAAEIGVVIGRSEAATQKRLSRALRRLKEKYRE